jgi:hypothetical protein
MMEFEQHPTEPDTLVIKMPKRYIAKHSDEDLRAAVLAEREACAKLCEDFEPESFYLGQLKNAAKAIRARGEK